MKKNLKLVALICLSIVYLTNKAQNISLGDIFLTYKFYGYTLPKYAFMNQENKYATLIEKEISLYDTKAESIKKIDLSPLSFDFYNFSFSNTDRYLLLQSTESRLYRRAGSAFYYIYDIDKNIASPVDDNQIYFPLFSNDDRKIAFVKDNNLYYKKLPNGKPIAITTDGKWNEIINGKSDWVYEEEWETTQAFAWNNTGDYLAYLKFDESQVEEFNFPYYNNEPYTQLFSYKYPKAGETNSKVSVWLYDINKKKQIAIKFKKFNYEYIPRIYWNNNNELYLFLFNRLQNDFKIIAYNIEHHKSSIIYEEQSNTYVDLPIGFQILKDNSFIITSEKDGFTNLYWYNNNGSLRKQLTNYKYDITKLYGFDEVNQKIYFQTNYKNTYEKFVEQYNVATEASILLSDEAGISDADFSPNYNFCFFDNQSQQHPRVYSIIDLNNNTKKVLEDNKKLADYAQRFPLKDFFQIQINNENLPAWMLKPLDFDSTKQYPLLMYVYGGPGSQEVLNEFSVSTDRYFTYLVSLGYVVACVDGRGTGAKGSAFKKCTYRQLGKYESDDQIAAAQYFGQLPFIDSSRIGIFGWSYGGFMSALCLLKGNTVFKVAISVAPVTNWKFYDNVYTERYMQTPTLNPNGYENNNPIAIAKQLKGKLLLIHGTADDNVHIQNTFELVNALNVQEKNFDLAIYPDKGHGISGGNARYDVFRKITHFLLENL